jgi:hypothetical protein
VGAVDDRSDRRIRGATLELVGEVLLPDLDQRALAAARLGHLNS